VRNGAIFLLAYSLVAPAFAQDLRTAQFLKEMEPGFARLYNLDYDEAEKSFTALRARFPDHPGPPLYLAGLIWQREMFQREDLKLERFIAPGYFTEPSARAMPPAERDRFFRFVEESQAISSRVLSLSPRDYDARYFLGACAALRASFAFTIDHNKTQAFRYGKQAYQTHLAIVAEKPDYYDAYVTIGVYEYVVASLPWYLKWMARIAGYHGSRERAFKYLELAAHHSMFVGDDARLLLMIFDVRDKRSEEALSFATILHSRFPRNFLLELNRGQILERMGRQPEAAEVYREVLRKAQAGIPNYDKMPVAFRETIRKAVDRRAE
jgi:tetratricopeptide (TPR) repeat protein